MPISTMPSSPLPQWGVIPTSWLNPGELANACQMAEKQGLTIRFILTGLSPALRQPCYVLVVSKAPDAVMVS